MSRFAPVTEWSAELETPSPQEWPLTYVTGHVLYRGRLSSYVWSCKGFERGTMVFAKRGQAEVWRVVAKPKIAGMHLRYRNRYYEFLRSGAV